MIRTRYCYVMLYSSAIVQELAKQAYVRTSTYSYLQGHPYEEMRDNLKPSIKICWYGQPLNSEQVFRCVVCCAVTLDLFSSSCWPLALRGGTRVMPSMLTAGGQTWAAAAAIAPNCTQRSCKTLQTWDMSTIHHHHNIKTPVRLRVDAGRWCVSQALATGVSLRGH